MYDYVKHGFYTLIKNTKNEGHNLVKWGVCGLISVIFWVLDMKTFDSRCSVQPKFPRRAGAVIALHPLSLCSSRDLCPPCTLSCLLY